MDLVKRMSSFGEGIGTVNMVYSVIWGNDHYDRCPFSSVGIAGGANKCKRKQSMNQEGRMGRESQMGLC